MMNSTTKENQNAPASFAADTTFRDCVLLDVREVARIMKVPVSWVYERTRRRGSEQLPHLKIGKYLRFRLHEVESYLEALRRG